MFKLTRGTKEELATILSNHFGMELDHNERIKFVSSDDKTGYIGFQGGFDKDGTYIYTYLVETTHMPHKAYCLGYTIEDLEKYGHVRIVDERKGK